MGAIKICSTYANRGYKAALFILSLAAAHSGDVNAVTSKPDVAKPWGDKGWEQCVGRYKRAYQADNRINIYRYINGKCGPDADKELSRLSDGECFMKVSGPAAILNTTGYERMLVCNERGSEEQVCSNKSSGYNDTYKAKMRSDPRCAGFPNLVSDPLGAKPIQANIQHADLANKGSCRSAVAKVRRLENDPNFDNQRSIRLQWQDAVEYALALKCNL